MLTVGSIVGGAFRLVKQHPGAVAVWGLVYFLMGMASFFAMRPLLGMQQAALGGDPQVAMANAMSMFGRLMLIQFAIFLVMMILFTASQRAVLRPQEGGFAYLRVGLDEVRIIALSVFLAVLFYLGIVILMLVVIAIVGAFAFAGGGPAAGLLMFLPMLAIIPLIVWLQVRLSLTFPLTVLRKHIVIGESWRLTRGRFWTLFGGYFVVGLILLVLWGVVAAFTAGPYFAEIMRNGFTPASLEAAGARQMAEQYSDIGPLTVLGWILGAVLGGLAIALTGGAVATAARELAGDEVLAREFA